MSTVVLMGKGSIRDVSVHLVDAGGVMLLFPAVAGEQG